MTHYVTFQVCMCLSKPLSVHSWFVWWRLSSGEQPTWQPLKGEGKGEKSFESTERERKGGLSRSALANNSPLFPPLSAPAAFPNLVPGSQYPIFLPRSCSPSPSPFTPATQATWSLPSCSFLRLESTLPHCQSHPAQTFNIGTGYRAAIHKLCFCQSFFHALRLQHILLIRYSRRSRQTLKLLKFAALTEPQG